MNEPLKIPTDRSFGITFTVVLGLLGGWAQWRASRFGLPLLGASAAFALVSFTVPRILHPLNVVWMRFGLLLNMIVSPLIMGVIFFGIFTPVSLFFRLTGRDALRRSYEREKRSYWIDRTPPGPDGKSLPRQF